VNSRIPVGVRRRSLPFVLIILWLAACGGGTRLHGTYSDQMGAMQYRFKPDGNVSVAVMGIETQLKYRLEGKRVRIISPQGNQVLDLQEDGTLEGPLGMKFTRQP
jgi:hypothetical protein